MPCSINILLIDGINCCRVAGHLNWLASRTKFCLNMPLIVYNLLECRPRNPNLLRQNCTDMYFESLRLGYHLAQACKWNSIILLSSILIFVHLCLGGTVGKWWMKLQNLKNYYCGKL